MSEVNAVKKKTLGDRFAEFKAMEGADKRRVISGALINNAMYIIIAIAVIFIAIKVPAFVRLPSIINIISLPQRSSRSRSASAVPSSSPVRIFRRVDASV